MKTETHAKPTHEQIAARAYTLYLENGCQEDHALQDWLRAEELLTMEMTEQAASSSGRTEMFRVPPPSAQRAPDSKESSLASHERHSASRAEIRRQTTPMRPASRQSHPNAERGH
jgi:hypothetical protein